MSLKNRITQLELRADDNRSPVPALIYWSQKQSLEDAKQEYTQRHGYSLPKDAPIIQFVACDMSREGNGRELSKEEFKSLSEVQK